MKKNINILAITLARGGSKSIKNKNIALIKGKPLIYYTIREAVKSKYIKDYIVSTDSYKIMKVVNKLGISTPFKRPKKLSSDKSTSVEALKHALLFMENKNKIKYDIVVELMCTNPLKNIDDIEKCIEIMLKNKSAESVIAVHQLYDHHPARIKKILNGKIRDFCIKEKNESRRQDLKPKAYIRSGSIYVMKRNYLLKKNKRYGGVNSMAYILPDKRAVNIDTPIDLKLAELLTIND
jgi:CMP-N-acetylneuraminic acid synthetase